MKVVLSLEIGPYDRPLAEIVAGDEDDETQTSMTLWLSDDLSLTGARADVERFVRDLAAQVAMAEGNSP